MTSTNRLREIIAELPPFAIAASGGVDSTTLALIAHTVRRDIDVYHAISPAVPARASERLRGYATRHDWNLQEIRAGEFDDRDYVRNPVNRCYFCKMNLYSEICRHTDRLILSGTNFDDLSDFRPGLEAASEHAVRHPFVDAKMTKQDVRALACALGDVLLAELPASPCLSSRIETGIAIDSDTLKRVDEIEIWLAESLRAATARCRVRLNAVSIELDEERLAALTSTERQLIRERVSATLGGTFEIRITEYRMGSAFLRSA